MEQNSKIFPFLNWQVIFLLSLLVFTVYLNSLGNDFVSDDIPGILQNKYLADLKHILSNPKNCLRPLLYFTLFKIGGPNPFLYRLANIFFHLGNTLLVYILVGLLHKPVLAFFSASLFAVHPIMVESVTWISGGIHAQYSFFVLFSLIFFVLFKQKENKKFLVISLFLFLLALNSSEKAIILPLLAFLFSLSFENFSQALKDILPFLIIGLVLGLGFFGAMSRRLADLQSEFYHSLQTTNPLVEIPIAITSYLELIFWPKNLTLYHSEMFFDQGEYLFRLGILFFFLIGLVYFFNRNRQVFFWLSFFLISLLPTLIPLGISWIVAERYVYLGSIGIIVLMALIIEKIGEIFRHRKIPYALLTILILIFGARTMARNTDWADQDSLWLATARTSPSSPQNHNNLGDLYSRQGNFEKAAEEFQKAIELKPNYGDAYHNLANTYHQMGKKELAVENYQKALSLNPNFWQSYQGLAIIYFESKEFEKAAQILGKAIQINPQNPSLYLNLGVIYSEMGRQQEAEKWFQKAKELNPDISIPLPAN